MSPLFSDIVSESPEDQGGVKVVVVVVVVLVAHYYSDIVFESPEDQGGVKARRQQHVTVARHSSTWYYMAVQQYYTVAHSSTVVHSRALQ